MSEKISLGIYNLNWSFERLRLEEGTETSITGMLKYQISEKGIEEIKNQYGDINFRALEELLSYRIMNALFLTLRETSGRNLLEQRDIFQNRTRILIRTFIKEMGLNYVDLTLVDIWIWGEEKIDTNNF
ncbi:MAG: hypothetical protein ACFFC7_21810 [Candidatus Hermodarchaeota archaeon]